MSERATAVRIPVCATSRPKALSPHVSGLSVLKAALQLIGDASVCCYGMLSTEAGAAQVDTAVYGYCVLSVEVGVAHGGRRGAMAGRQPCLRS